MGVPWLIFVLPVLIHSGFTMTIEKGDSELIYNLTQSGNQYTMYLEENNRVEGADNLLLFYFKDASSKPSCGFISTNSFQLEITLGSSSNYELHSTQYFDYEKQANLYRMRCSGDKNEEILVFIHIVNIDDEPPTLTTPMCSMKENVEYDLSNTECNCTLEDPDGWLSKTTFTIINSNPNADKDLDMEDKLFQFYFDESIPDNEHSTTVYITTLKTLDYETKIFYSFNVQAKDGAGHPTTPKEDVRCLIDVIDQNDQPPTWTDYFTTKQILEEESHSFNVTAVDGDRGINAAIEYSIISYPKDVVCRADPCVSIAAQNGTGVITVNPIDRDEKDLTTYIFEIMAQEIDEPPFTANITITFFIDDIDDNSPLFMSVTTSSSTTNFSDIQPKIAEFTFFENFAGTIDGKIFIKDIDTGVNAQFDVLLMEDDKQTNMELRDIELIDYEANENNIHYTDAFMVVPTAGYRKGDFQISVKNATYLDFENPPWQNFAFYVHSSGKDIEKRKDDLLIKINLLDYNDESPVFPNSSYSTSKYETIEKGEIIIQVKATDKDAEDATLTHQLIAADSIAKLLDIDSTEGIITVAIKDAFDYDRINPIFFQVKAIDHAEPPHETIVPVTLNLLDVNNKAPTYESKKIINVDENQAIGIVLSTNITASDVDTTRNLTAEIDWSKSYVTKNSQRLNTADPVIAKAMQFLDLQYEIIANDTIEILLIVNYTPANPAVPDAPDYETFDTLYLDIKITDWNTKLPEFADKMSIEALIAININDINDNAPIFTPKTLSENRTAYENSNAGIIVGSIQATDADIGDNVTYSCSYKIEKYDWFTCDTYGVITVSENGKIDCDTDLIHTVNISCIASDGVHNTSQDFSIYILDKNNKTPYIKVNDTDPSAPFVKVEEKSEKNTFVTKINYTDADRDIPYHTASCSFDPSDECFEQFYIQDNDVLVKNERTLNRDAGPEKYECNVYCVDNPNHEQEGNQKDNSSSFEIKLIDINDHCPELKTHEMATKENKKKDSLIGEILAQDIDADENAEIDISVLSVIRDGDSSDFTYLFATKNISDEDYRVNLTFKRWHLVANQDLRDLYGTYTLQLKLNDHGDPPKSTEDDEKLKENSTIILKVSRYNYYEPKFVFPHEDQPEKNKFVLSMDQEPNKPLVMFENNDGQVFPDIKITTGENDDCLEKWEPSFNVSLRGSSSSLINFFDTKKLDGCTAQLQVKENYIRTQAKKYELTISTNLSDIIPDDETEAPYTKSVNLTINFADITGDPTFNQSLWNFSLPEGNITAFEKLPSYINKCSYTDKCLCTVALPYPAQYDGDLNITKFYSLITEDQNARNTFKVDPNTGAVSLLQELNYLKVRNYEFYIFAARNRSSTSPQPPNPSMLRVTIIVEDINDHAPEWTQESFFGAIMTSSQIGSIIVTADATDLDVMDNNHLHYKLNETINRSGSESIYNIDCPFIMNENTGDIKLNFPVEYNMKGYFFFNVHVQDNQDSFLNGPLYNQTQVTIYIVTEDNTLILKFENGLDDIVKRKKNITDTIGDDLGWKCHDYSIYNDSQNGNQLTNVTAFSLYCVKNNTLLTADEIKTKLNNLETFRKIKQDLLNHQVLLLNFDSDSTKVDNLEASLKVALIAVSVVLGALCIILAVTFFLKTRELNRRLNQLVEPKFGSDESNLNRKGIKAPGTNLYASGANPVYNQEIKRDEYDKSSVHSGDSELIGVEDSPEFDDIFSIDNDKQRF